MNIAKFERLEAISFHMWVSSLNKTGFPKNDNGTMMDIWQLYDYWYYEVDQKPFWTHADQDPTGKWTKPSLKT